MCTQKPPHDYSEQLYGLYKEAFNKYITEKVSERAAGCRLRACLLVHLFSNCMPARLFLFGPSRPMSLILPDLSYGSYFHSSAFELGYTGLHTRHVRASLYSWLSRRCKASALQSWLTSLLAAIFKSDNMPRLCDSFRLSSPFMVACAQVMPSLQEHHDEVLLKELFTRWNNHKLMVRWLSRFFNYLDRCVHENPSSS